MWAQLLWLSFLTLSFANIKMDTPDIKHEFEDAGSKYGCKLVDGSGDRVGPKKHRIGSKEGCIALCTKKRRTHKIINGMTFDVYNGRFCYCLYNSASIALYDKRIQPPLYTSCFFTLQGSVLEPEQWSVWSASPVCSKTCLRNSTRFCVNAVGKKGGKSCPGAQVKAEPCDVKKCAVNGQWGKWGAYTKCSQTCGGGTHHRSRQCDNPAPTHGGRSCDGTKAEIKRCNNDKCPEFLIESSTAIRRNNLVNTVTMEKEYTVTFDVFATALLYGWRSVIHFTASGNNGGKYGDRIPAVYFYGNKISIISAVSGNWNYYVYSKPVKAKKWYTVVIKQTKEADGKYWYTNTVDGTKVTRQVNTDPRRFENVKVYAADPWYYPAAGKIRNLSVTVG